MATSERFQLLSAEVDSAIDKLGGFLGLLVETPVSANSQASQAIDSQLQRFYAAFYALKKRQREQKLSVAVLALTKSGKSTFLNALCGANCLPANNVPETARICQIVHTPLQPGEHPVLTDSTQGGEPVVKVGEKEIHSHLKYLNREVRSREHHHSDEVLLDIQIPIAALQVADASAQTASNISFRLLDTPGPNEAGEEALRYQVERLLDGVDALIYLLDYTKLKTKEEAEMFSKLREINPQIIARLSQRLFFVVNKADCMHTNEGLDAEGTKQYVSDLITAQLQQSIEMRPEQILLVSAREAYLARLTLRGSQEADVRQSFKRIAFGTSARFMTPPAAEIKAAAEAMFEASGLPQLEDRVLSFLYNQSAALKLLAVMDDVSRTLQQIKNVTDTSYAALKQDVEGLQRDSDSLQQQLQETLNRFEDVQQEAQQVESEVVDEVRARLHFLQGTLFEQVQGVLDTQAEVPHVKGRWRGIWDKAHAFFSRRNAAGMEREALQATLVDLHADVFAQLETEVNEFWHQLEAATNERQRLMFRHINRRLEALSRAIEAAVQCQLDVRLEAVDIRLTPPTADAFHASLQQLFAEGIAQSSVVKQRTREEQYVVWEKRYRNGICRTGQYFVGRPETRTVVEDYTETVYDVQPDRIRTYFENLISGAIETSIRSARMFVRQYMTARIDDARKQICEYGERYTETMLAALNTSRQGEEARMAALARVMTFQSRLAELAGEVAAAQAHAERLFPVAAEGLGFDGDAVQLCGADFQDATSVGTPSLHEEQGSEWESDDGVEAVAGALKEEEGEAAPENDKDESVDPQWETSEEGDESEASSEQEESSEEEESEGEVSESEAAQSEGEGEQLLELRPEQVLEALLLQERLLEQHKAATAATAPPLVATFVAAEPGSRAASSIASVQSAATTGPVPVANLMDAVTSLVVPVSLVDGQVPVPAGEANAASTEQIKVEQQIEDEEQEAAADAAEDSPFASVHEEFQSVQDDSDVLSLPATPPTPKPADTPFKPVPQPASTVRIVVEGAAAVGEVLPVCVNGGWRAEEDSSSEAAAVIMVQHEPDSRALSAAVSPSSASDASQEDWLVVDAGSDEEGAARH